MDQVFAGAVPILAVFFAWVLGEYGKRQASLNQRKEKRYEGLVRALSGFYANAADPQQREAFLEEWRITWLYCPDCVVLAGNRFLAAVESGSGTDEESRRAALSDFVSVIRRDLHRRSSLSGSDFAVYGVNRLPYESGA
jgi:hypothetical protein